MYHLCTRAPSIETRAFAAHKCMHLLGNNNCLQAAITSKWYERMRQNRFLKDDVRPVQVDIGFLHVFVIKKENTSFVSSHHHLHSIHMPTLKACTCRFDNYFFVSFIWPPKKHSFRIRAGLIIMIDAYKHVHRHLWHSDRRYFFLWCCATELHCAFNIFLVVARYWAKNTIAARPHLAYWSNDIFLMEISATSKTRLIVAIQSIVHRESSFHCLLLQHVAGWERNLFHLFFRWKKKKAQSTFHTALLMPVWSCLPVRIFSVYYSSIEQRFDMFWINKDEEV